MSPSAAAPIPEDVVAVARFLSERLLFLATLIAGSAFWAQGLAFGLLTFGILPRFTDRSSGPWVEIVTRSSLILGGVFVTGGLLLLVVRLSSPAESRPAAAAPARDGTAALMLLMLSGAALAVSAPLRELWVEILLLLGQAGDWSELWRSGGAGSGLVLAPLMVLLYTPLLAALAALSLIALPALLALARVARSGRFGRLLTSSVICASVLVVAAWFAAEAFQRLVAMAEPMLRRDPDPTGAQVADLMTRGAAVLVRSVRAQGLILGALWVLWPFLRQRPQPIGDLELERELELAERTLTGLDADLAPEPGIDSEQPWWRKVGATPLERSSAPEPAADRPSAPARGASHPLRAYGVGGIPTIAYTAALVFGLFMVVSGAVDRVRPRANWTSSDPVPGANLESAPAEVLITFDRPLARGSELRVSLTRAIDPKTGEITGEGTGDVARGARIDPENRYRLRAELAPAAGLGLYWVQWRAVSTGGGVPRRGSFPFVVGPVHPDLIGGPPQATPSRDEDQRRRRSVLLGGVILVLIGAIPYALRLTDPRT